MMIEKTAITIPDDVRTAFMAFDDDYLADVLRLWDCDLRNWHDPFVTILRFENDDIMVWYEDGALTCCQGAFDNYATLDYLPHKVKAGINSDACLCWLRDKHYDELVGSTHLSFDLLDRFV